MQHLPPETWRWDAVDLARAIRLGVSAREATQAALARLAAVNPSINAVVDPLRDPPGTRPMRRMRRGPGATRRSAAWRADHREGECRHGGPARPPTAWSPSGS